MRFSRSCTDRQKRFLMNTNRLVIHPEISQAFAQKPGFRAAFLCRLATFCADAENPLRGPAIGWRNIFASVTRVVLSLRHVFTAKGSPIYLPWFGEG
jgi:hypothetical protein